MSTDHLPFFNYITNEENDWVAAKSRYPYSTMILFSRKTHTPLVALILHTESKSVNSILTARPAPASMAADNPNTLYFQGMLTKENEAFFFTVSNLQKEGYLNFNLLTEGRGINQVNALKPGETYTIPCDQQTNQKMVLKGKKHEGTQKAITVGDVEADAAPATAPKGLYVHLNVAPDNSKPKLVKWFEEGTYWKCTPFYVYQQPKLQSRGAPYRNIFHENFNQQFPWRGTEDQPIAMYDPPSSTRTPMRKILSTSRQMSQAMPRSMSMSEAMPSAMDEPLRFTEPDDEEATLGVTDLFDEPTVYRSLSEQSFTQKKATSKNIKKKSDLLSSIPASVPVLKPVPSLAPEPTNSVPVGEEVFSDVSQAYARSNGDDDDDEVELEVGGDDGDGGDGGDALDSPTALSSSSLASISNSVLRSQAADLDYVGDKVNVRSVKTNVEFDYTNISVPAVLCLSLLSDFKLINCSDDDLRQDIRDAIQLQTKRLNEQVIADLPCIYPSETCVLDLESKPDTIIISCGHQCVHSKNLVGCKLQHCPLCRTRITSFVQVGSM